jgi:hypothetical protein
MIVLRKVLKYLMHRTIVSIGGPMLHHVPDSEEISLRELRAKRKTLWRRFEDNPNEIRLAAKLKIIDDQIAQLNQQIDVNNIDDSEVAAVPKIGGIFLLLAVSPRESKGTRKRGSTPNSSTDGSQCRLTDVHC